ncbi:MAG: D-arabinono-1,4-lactone oxidase [Solirubrobacteraceae bacterium]
MRETNWAGNYTYRASEIHRPRSLEEVQEIAASAAELRVLGSGHSFTAVVDAKELLSLERMPSDVSIDREAGTVSFGAQLRYGELAQSLDDEGVALANLASLPHICVAGAIATATHGSGDTNGNLATSVAGLELVTSDGEVRTASRADEDFNGLVVSLGALGVVTRVTLDIEPGYEVRQRAFNDLSWDALLAHFDEITSSGYSVSIFTLWDKSRCDVWVKTRVSDAPELLVENFFGATASRTQQHMIAGVDPANCTPQLGLPGPWSQRLPHFRMGFTPSSGEEIQSEYHVPRRHAVAALEAVRAHSKTFRPLLLVSEIRTVAADDLWLSPQYRQDTVAIHFTWRPEQAAVERVLIEIEFALAPFEPRPHWGKVFVADAAALAPRYPRLDDFVALLARSDTRGAFTNAWLRTRLLGHR